MTEQKFNETCNECGKSVAFGSGNYVNRVADGDSVAERTIAGKPHPRGDFICAECDVDVIYLAAQRQIEEREDFVENLIDEVTASLIDNVKHFELGKPFEIKVTFDPDESLSYVDRTRITITQD